MIEILATGIVYRNPKPYLRSVHTWHPSISRIEDRTLVATFDLGQAVESLDYRTYCSRSLDGGETWSDPQPLISETLPRPASCTVRTRNLRDGRLFGFGGRLYRDHPEEGLVNRENLGYVQMDLILVESRDQGMTWSPPTTIEPPLVGPSFEICHPIVELSDGRLLAPTSTWKGWNGEAPNGMKAVALVSHDSGRSWPEFLEVMDGYESGLIHFEQSLVELPGGGLLAVAWAYNEKTGKTEPTPYVLSEDGVHFSKSQATGLRAQTAKILALPDGDILCAYRRDDRPGLWANRARIEGTRWVNHEEQVLWQGASSGMSGEKAGGQELAELKFGYPSMVSLGKGEVFLVFWCEEGGVNNIRWLRLRV